MNRFIPLSVPNFEGNEKKYVDSAIEEGWVSTGGAYVKTLEKKIATFIKSEDVCVCQSGTSALHLSLVECDIKPGDTVIVPTLTFIAAVNPVKYQFANTVFMDCDDSLCIDPVKLKSFCERECNYINNKLYIKKTNSQVKAVIVVHVFGNMVDMEAVMNIAEKYNLKVIEDATEALGSYYTYGRYKGRFAGTIGDFGAFSFNGNKIITTGGGGAITSRNKEIVRHLKYLSTQAKDDDHYYLHNEIGYNYRMTNLQAALGAAQMEKLSEFIKRKHENFDIYKKFFENFKYASLLDFREGTYSNQWFYSLIINRDYVNISLKEIIVKLEEYGIQTRPVWGLIHQQKPYIDSHTYKIDKALYYKDCVLNIPCSTQITASEIKYVSEKIKAVLIGFSKE